MSARKTHSKFQNTAFLLVKIQITINSRNFSDTLENLVKTKIVTNIIHLAHAVLNKLQIWEN